ncbi:MAG: NAD-dependent epimerase/dehydratase family protein [Chloroflexi bacterium]|nr:NAD-dependent epimerase/dehydratase family protein [Chloroflexota bacterium]
MNILVTGATGFIGSHLCAGLIVKGHRVFGLTRSGRTDNIRALLEHKQFKLQTGDIRDKDFVRSLLNSCAIEVVYHLAARLPGSADIDNPAPSVDINATGTLNLLDAAYKAGIGRFIYSSSMSVYSEPPSYLPVDEGHPTQPSGIYGGGKLAGEFYCNMYRKHMDITVLRYGGAYGRGERDSDAIATFIRQALRDQPITIFGDGTQTSDFVYIDDLVQGSLSALESGQKGTFNIGGGEEMSVNDLARRIIKVVGSKSEVVLTGENSERPFRFVLDVTRARRAFGYNPRPFDDGIRAYLNEINIIT